MTREVMSLLTNSVAVRRGVVRKAVSAASRLAQMRTSERVGASRVASTTHQVPSTSASTTAWKSIGDRPGA